MHYLIAVLPDRIQAEAAYTALEKDNVPLAQVSILGQGYKSADEFGFIKPEQPAKQQAQLMAYWLIPFGFILGFSFDFLTNISLFPWLGNAWAGHILGGALGASFAAVGSFVVGGGVGLLVGGGDALIYRNRLNAGKYLIVVKGAEPLIQKATPILRQFDLDNIQGYTEPPS